MTQKTENLKYFDANSAKTTKAHLQTFVNQLNEWLEAANNEGLEVTSVDQLFKYLADSQKIKDYFKKLAKQDAKQFKLNSAKNQLFEEAEKTAESLIKDLRKVLNLQYTGEHTQPVFWESKIIAKLKSYFQLEGGKVTLTNGFEEVINKYFTSEADSKAKEIYEKLNKAITAVEEYNKLMHQEGLDRDSYQLKIDGKLLYNDGRINTQELAKRNWQQICEQSRKKAKEQAEHARKVEAKEKRKRDADKKKTKLTDWLPSGGQDVSSHRKDPQTPKFLIKR